MNPQQPHQVRNQQYDNSAGHQAPNGNQGHQNPQNPRGGRWYQPTLASKIVVALVIIAGLAVLASLISGVFMEASKSTDQNLVKTDRYQAVFLTNDQVYFGDITKTGNGLMVLEDVYYLQVNQQIQPDQGEAQDNQQPEVSLAKLGNELHGPEDEMFISSDKVVFWENLKPESQVSQAIRQNEQNQQNDAVNQNEENGTNNTGTTEDTNGQSNGRSSQPSQQSDTNNLNTPSE